VQKFTVMWAGLQLMHATFIRVIKIIQNL